MGFTQVGSNYRIPIEATQAPPPPQTNQKKKKPQEATFSLDQFTLYLLEKNSFQFIKDQTKGKEA